jgi:hypothetical protein
MPVSIFKPARGNIEHSVGMAQHVLPQAPHLHHVANLPLGALVERLAVIQHRTMHPHHPAHALLTRHAVCPSALACGAD